MKVETAKTYEDGLRDGSIASLKVAHKAMEARIFTVETVQAVQQRIVWGLVGAITLVQFSPSLISKLFQ